MLVIVARRLRQHPVFVAILSAIIDTAARYFLPDIGAFAIYVLLIVLMVLRPDGLLPSELDVTDADRRFCSAIACGCWSRPGG